MFCFAHLAAVHLIADMCFAPQVPEPQLKQYSLYLLDSICKNLRGRFAEAAGVNLKQTFTTVYNAVQRDAALKKSLFKVLATWHDVFPKDLVLSIEFFLKSQGETPLAPVAILPAASSGSKSAAPGPVGGKSAPKPRDAPPTSRPPPHRQEQRPPAPQPREPPVAPAWAGHGAWDPAAPPPVVQGAYYPPPAAQGGYYPPPGPAGGWAQPYYPPHEYPAPDPAAPYPVCTITDMKFVYCLLPSARPCPNLMQRRKGPGKRPALKLFFDNRKKNIYIHFETIFKRVFILCHFLCFLVFHHSFRGRLSFSRVHD